MSDKRGNGPTYDYDPTGRLTKRTWARGIETDYTYNPLGQLTAIIYSNLDTPDVAFTYNRMGQQTTVTDATGTRGFAYDTSFQQIQETNWLATLDRTYDTLGRPTGIALGTNYSVSYTYDAYSRLATVADFTYTYLPHSDLIATTNNGTTTTYAANELNQYTNITPSPTELIYDLDGNLLDDGTWTYSWDAENRLISVSSNNTLVIQNQYDYMSRRISKTTAITTNTFTYDAWNLISESSTAHTNNNYYIWV